MRWVCAGAVACLMAQCLFPQTQRDMVLAQMRLRPVDPWPRGIGHVILTGAGAGEEAKSYEEPGGSFSPWVGSPSVSIWVFDESGALKTTSDTVPISEVRQKFDWRQGKLEGVRIETPYYSEHISSKGAIRISGEHLAFVIRSVGPAGAPINEISYADHWVRAGRSAFEVDREPLAVSVGEEGSAEWLKPSTEKREWRGEGGWGYARLKMPKCSPCTLKSSLLSAGSRVETNLVVKVPDERFAESLYAQIAHLELGLVGNQTRPGDPANYPLPWLRDGAYVVVALARSGHVDRAKELARYFAANDFFGGFGSEADAPGLALWALGEVADRVADRRFDVSIFPHVHRKAALILEMMTAQSSIRKRWVGPIAPQHRAALDLDLVAEPARDGLINGRMDWHRPLLFVNAVSYLGLLEAAAIADRAGHKDEAKRWRSSAAVLQAAYLKALGTKEMNNDRTFISAMYPTGAALPAKPLFEDALAARWSKLRTEAGDFRKPPVWTYFDVAEAHQWLVLGKPQKTWQTLDWFWAHQASPGLYTWTEGTGEENSFRRWENVRGWVNPPYVSPHYWTAAEMLLLQLDMLASVREDELVIGAGVPSSWLRENLIVKGIAIPGGTLQWSWDGKRLSVETSGSRKWRIVPGPAFPR